MAYYASEIFLGDVPAAGLRLWPLAPRNKDKRVFSLGKILGRKPEATRHAYDFTSRLGEALEPLLPGQNCLFLCETLAGILGRYNPINKVFSDSIKS